MGKNTLWKNREEVWGGGPVLGNKKANIYLTRERGGGENQ